MSLQLSQVSKVLTINLAFFTNVEISESLVRAWHLHFKNCTPEEFATAFHIAVDKNCTGFPPVPGQVWEIIRKLRSTQESLESADQAWHLAWQDSKNMSERTKAAILLMPGWDKKGYWKEESLPFKKKEFERIYNDLKERDEILETQNIARTKYGYGREQLTDAQQKIIGELSL